MKREECIHKHICNEDYCNEFCPRFIEMEYLLESSGIPLGIKLPIKIDKKSPGDYDCIQFQELTSYTKNIVNHVENGDNLYICSSNPGNGKTSWSINMLISYFDKVWPCNGLKIRGLFIPVTKFLNDLKNFDRPMSEAFLNAIETCDLVVWDDIATANKTTDYEYSKLFSYIDYRILTGKANIFTSNVTDLRQLQQKLGNRLASRLYMTSTVIKLDGDDHRTNDKLKAFYEKGGQ